jgi:hypothetical protein
VEGLLPFEEHYDKDGNPTGKIRLKAKNAASGKKKNGEVFERRINVFDAANKPQQRPVEDRPWSILKLSVKLFPFVAEGLKKGGVTLWLEAVKVLKLGVERRSGRGRLRLRGRGGVHRPRADVRRRVEQRRAACGSER